MRSYACAGTSRRPIQAAPITALIGTLNALLFAGLSAAVVLYQIVNFHHYIVDALIWKGPKPATRESLPLIA